MSMSGCDHGDAYFLPEWLGRYCPACGAHWPPVHDDIPDQGLELENASGGDQE